MKKVLPLGIIAYEFDDLTKQKQDLVIYDHIDFLIETREYDAENKGNFEKAVDEANRMQTPWYVATYIYDYCKDEIIEVIKSNNYLFDSEGDLLPITDYVDKDNKIVKSTYRLSKFNEIDVTIVEIKEVV